MKHSLPITALIGLAVMTSACGTKTSVETKAPPTSVSGATVSSQDGVVKVDGTGATVSSQDGSVSIGPNGATVSTKDGSVTVTKPSTVAPTSTVPASAAPTSASAAPAAGGTPIVINGDHTSSTQDCGQGRSVTIDSDFGVITLTGNCSSISLNGNHTGIDAEKATVGSFTVLGDFNNIEVDGVNKVMVKGDHNGFTWKKLLNGASPSISNDGTFNNLELAN
jgi:hypothetical protein